MHWIHCLLLFYLIRAIKNLIKKVIYYFDRSIEFVHHVHYFMMNRIEFLLINDLSLWWSVLYLIRYCPQRNNAFQIDIGFFSRKSINCQFINVHCPLSINSKKKTLVNSYSELKTILLHDSIVDGCVFDSILYYQIPLLGTFNHFIYQKSFFTSCDFNFAL